MMTTAKQPYSPVKPDTSEKGILNWYNSKEKGFIWAYMHGKPMPGDKYNKVVKINKNEIALMQSTITKEYMFKYDWGWPGPDFNLYKFSDYGISWAFIKEELEHKEEEK